MKTARLLVLALALLMIPLAATAASPPAAKAAASCGSNFCTTAQRNACNQQCFAHHHGPFVGLECCTDTCTTLCICGSVPVGC